MYQNPHTAIKKRRWSHGFAVTLVVATVFLLVAGALVTGTGSSLAVPDWPLAYGQLFPPMVGGILYEHGHRLIATTVGMITLVLSGWLWWVEPRRWVKGLGFLAVGSVITQGVLGGITVLLLLPKAVSISHAIMAQLFLVLAVVLAQVTAPGWESLRARRGAEGRARIWGRFTCAIAFLTLALGATMRHHSAGMAIPDFPLAYGQLVPPLTSFEVTVHFLHRVGAWTLVVVIAGTMWETLRRHRGEPALVRAAMVLGILAILQVVLGAVVIWSHLSIPLTTLHLVNGGLLLASAGLFTLRAEMLENPPVKIKTGNG